MIAVGGGGVGRNDFWCTKGGVLKDFFVIFGRSEGANMLTDLAAGLGLGFSHNTLLVVIRDMLVIEEDRGSLEILLLVSSLVDLEEVLFLF